MLIYATVTWTVNFHETIYECHTLINGYKGEVYEFEGGVNKLDIYKKIHIQMINNLAMC